MPPPKASEVAQTVVTTGRGPLAKMKALLYALIGPSDKSLLPFVPRPVKLLVALIFILNWRSWPFVWHWKVWKHVFEIRWDKWRRARGGIPAHRRWVSDRSCVNADPFEIVSTIQCYAGVDDCDYNMHLSNSCYAKSVDSARMKAAMDVFPAIFGDGAWMPLAGAQYQFIREIPFGTHYEIQSTVGGWEDKWIFLVHYYVSYPSKNTRSKSASQAIGHPISAPTSTVPGTPSLIDSPPQSNSPKPPTKEREPYKPPRGLDLTKLRKPLKDGAVVHCVAVSLYCFKIGRITIPPRVALIAAGFGDPAKQRWFRVQELRFSAPDPMLVAKSKGKGKVKNRMTDMLKGGWRTDDYVPEWAAKRTMATTETGMGMDTGKPVDASWMNVDGATSTTTTEATATSGYFVGEHVHPAPSPIDIASPISAGDSNSTPNMASSLPPPPISATALPAARQPSDSLPPLTPAVAPGNGFWDLPEFEERRRETMKDIFGGMMEGLRGLREKGVY